MVSPDHVRTFLKPVPAAIIVLILIFSLLTCGCLDVEPEELPPPAASPSASITESPTVQATGGPAASPPPAIHITSPRQTGLFTEQDFPPEVKTAVSDFSIGKTSGSVNGFLRWESVRARTNKEDTARIRDQIRRIDYALYNSSQKENITVYVGLSVDQARKVRNDSVFSENGYLIASYDPSVVYQQYANSGRDGDGYFTLCRIDFYRGNHLLFVNGTVREFLLPRGSIWDVAGEDTYEELVYAIDSIPLYDDIVPTKVRVISTREHP
jgi:hypothetical protein